MTYLLAHSLAREMLNSIAGIYMSLIAAMPSAQTLLLSFPSVTEAAAAPQDCRAPSSSGNSSLGLE